MSTQDPHGIALDFPYEQQHLRLLELPPILLELLTSRHPAKYVSIGLQFS